MKPIYPDHITRLSDNMRDVRMLVDIHVKMTGAGPGYKANVEVLNKSAIVLVVACWEAYVKDLAVFTFDTIFEGISDPHKFPQRVLIEATKELRTSQDQRRLLELTGDGWRNVLAEYRKKVTLEVNQRFSPNPKSIDDLFEKLTGFRTLSSTISWRGCSNQRALKRLDGLLSLRNSIAHRIEGTRRVFKYDVQHGVDLIHRLAAASSNVVRNYLIGKLGLQAWLPVVLTSEKKGAR